MKSLNIGMGFVFSMIHRGCISALILGTVLLTLPIAGASAVSVEHVVIVSIDGGRPDVILNANTPNIHEMAMEGAYTWWAQTVIPSITLVSHGSMLTGSLPAEHGISWNKWSPDDGYVKTTTCFELAKKGKLTTAMFVGKPKLKHIAKPDTVDRFEIVNGDAIAVAKAAGSYLQENKPNLLFVHFADPDRVGHEWGWGSKEHAMAIELCDEGIGSLRRAAEDANLDGKLMFIVTADHGGHGKTHGSADVRSMTIPWVCYGPGMVRPGQIEKTVSTCDTAATAVYALGLEMDTNWIGLPMAHVLISDARRPQVRVPQTPPRADGDPRKVDWEKAVRGGVWQTLKGAPTARKVEARFAQDGEYLYVCLTEEANALRLVNDAGIFEGDDWELLFAAKHGEQPYRQMGINPKGEYMELVYGESTKWTSGVNVISEVGANFWTVRMGFPLSRLLPGGARSGQSVYANIMRGGKDPLAWSPTFDDRFLQPGCLGEIVLE